MFLSAEGNISKLRKMNTYLKGENSNMIKQKKNKVLRTASLALVLTLITTCLSAYTLAKYTTSLSGTDTARVARFDFGSTINTYDENGNAIMTNAALATTAAAINVFSTSYDSAASLGTASTTTVKTSGTDKIIAPGVFGSFQYGFTGTSEVSIRISFDITETQTAANKVPMLYEYDGKYYSNQYTPNNHYLVLANDGSSIATINVAGNLAALATAVSDSIGIMDAGTDLSTATALTAAKTTVKWYWPFEEWTAASGGTLITGTGVGTDAYDTALGLLGSDTVKLDIAATATQVD